MISKKEKEELLRIAKEDLGEIRLGDRTDVFVDDCDDDYVYAYAFQLWKNSGIVIAQFMLDEGDKVKRESLILGDTATRRLMRLFGSKPEWTERATLHERQQLASMRHQIENLFNQINVLVGRNEESEMDSE